MYRLYGSSGNRYKYRGNWSNRPYGGNRCDRRSRIGHEHRCDR